MFIFPQSRPPPPEIDSYREPSPPREIPPSVLPPLTPPRYDERPLPRK